MLYDALVNQSYAKKEERIIVMNTPPISLCIKYPQLISPS